MTEQTESWAHRASWALLGLALATCARAIAAIDPVWALASVFLPVVAIGVELCIRARLRRDLDQEIGRLGRPYVAERIERARAQRLAIAAGALAVVTSGSVAIVFAG